MLGMVVYQNNSLYEELADGFVITPHSRCIERFVNLSSSLNFKSNLVI